MKLLIAVGEVPTQDAPPGVDALIEAAAEIQVMSPTLVGPLNWLTGDVDRARRAANDRLAVMLGRVDDDATDVSVADTGRDELAHNAVAEALDEFDADHVLIIAAKSDDLWRRLSVLERILDEYGKSVTITLI